MEPLITSVLTGYLPKILKDMNMDKVEPILDYNYNFLDTLVLTGVN